MLLSPVKKGELELCHSLEELGIIASLAHLFSHVVADFLDPAVAGMLLVADEKVKL